jgi:hypothetical protein
MLAFAPRTSSPTAPETRRVLRRALRQAAVCFGVTAFLLIDVAAGAGTGERGNYSIRSIFDTQRVFQAQLTRSDRADPTCANGFSLTELQGSGEHTVYGVVELLSAITLRMRARAVTRYSIQVGFASQDWGSFALATVSLVSGAHTTSDNGILKIVGSSIVPQDDGWVEITLDVADQRPAKVAAPGIAYALVKLHADGGGAKFYEGTPGHGVEFCATNW